MTKQEFSDYRKLFLEGRPLIDVRSRREFLKGSFPTASNIPLLNDEERASVGLCYKRHGQGAAIDLGNRLVSGPARAARLEAWTSFAQRNPAGYLYCFRGGLRSFTVQDWLNANGIHYPLVKGGYKAMRRFLINSLDETLTNMEVVLVSGRTGAGKTRVISTLERGIDLEGLAKHRGSAFGHLLEPQPSQIDFENILSIELLKAFSSSNQTIFVEDEGKLIGRVSLPYSLRIKMSKAPMVFVEAPLSERVEVVLQDYIVDLGMDYQKFYGDEGGKVHRQRLLQDLFRIRRRLGGLRQQRLGKTISAAFEKQWSSGCLSLHRDWIRTLLNTYYDPMYDYQLSQRDSSRLVTGSRSEITDWAKDYSGC